MTESSSADLLVVGAAQVLTCAASAPDLVGCRSGGVAVRDGRVVAVGDISGYVADYVIDAAGGLVMPGFIDAHTHVVFGGSRVGEYAAKVAGQPVPAGEPVGILGTVSSTRATLHGQLLSQAAARIDEMLAHGTTTLESKTGYGLSVGHEARLLEVNQRLSQSHDAGIVSTYLGAHAVPPELSPAQWVDRVIESLSAIGERHLADFCDVYCDEGYFDVSDTRRILHAGAQAGLKPKLHLDAYSQTGAADIAAELGAVSVDHLNYTSASQLKLLAEAGVTAVYLPCLDYAVAHPKPTDPRALADAGLEIALATDICPGCWTSSMQLAVAMACRSGGLSPAQALRAATYGSARALGRADRIGSLEPGKDADLIVLDIPDFADVAYRIGRNSVTTVVKGGRVVRQAVRTA